MIAKLSLGLYSLSEDMGEGGGVLFRRLSYCQPSARSVGGLPKSNHLLELTHLGTEMYISYF